MGKESLSRGNKAAGCGVDYPPPYRAEVKESGAMLYSSLDLHGFELYLFSFLSLYMPSLCAA